MCDRRRDLATGDGPLRAVAQGRENDAQVTESQRLSQGCLSFSE